MLNKNSLGVKSARSLRSSIVSGYMQPKALISTNARKCNWLSKNPFMYLNQLNDIR